MNRRRIAGLALVAGTLTAAAATWTDLEGSVSFEERLIAESNVLRLSDPEVSRLENDPRFQTDVEGPAAVKAEHRLGLGLVFPLDAKTGAVAWLQRITGSRPGRGRLELDYDGKLTSYEGSPANGYGSHRLTLGWRPRVGWGADLSWRKLDNFYLRQFRDRDTGGTHGATMDAEELRLRLRARAKDFADWATRPEAELTLAREVTNYNAWFTEYDTRDWSLGVDLGLRLPQDVDLDLGYAFAAADNVGFDGLVGGESVSVLQNDEGGDGSFEEDRWHLGLGWGPPGLPLDFGLGWLLRERWYSSDLGEMLDPVHSGRHDRRSSAELRATWRLGRQWALIPIVEREWRRVDGAWGGLAAVKDYTVWRAGLGVRWRM